MRKGMEPPSYINDNIYALSPQEKKERGIMDLPGSLKEALEALKEDTVLLDALGKPLTEKFLEIKEKEAQDFAVTVHPWELEKYVNV